MKLACRFALFTGIAFISVLTFTAHAQGPRELFQAEKAAVGGEAWKRVAAIRFSGKMIAGGAPGSFTELMDHRNGHSLLVVDTGSLHDESGFDGAIWNKQNGMVTIADLPALLSDAETQAFVNRDGWWNASDVSEIKLLPSQTEAGTSVDRIQVTPAKGTSSEVWLDSKTHLIVRIVAHADEGDQTTDYSDWRQTGGVWLPFRQVQTDERGATTTLEVSSARVEENLSPDALARPASQPRGTMEGAVSSSVTFRLTGGGRGHIIVPATINGRAATLLFDSGAANYFPWETARRFGLVVSGGVNLGGVGNGSTTGGFAMVDEISIGKAKLHDEAAMVGPLPYVAKRPQAGVIIDGLTGFEFLSEFRTTLDYAKQTLTFSRFQDDTKPKGVTEPYFSDGHDIYVEATIDGAHGLFRLDTGDHATVSVFRAFAVKHHLFEKGGTMELSAGGLGGTLPTHEFKDETFALAGTTFTRVPVSVSDTHTGSFASRSLAGNLGTGILSRFCITFDYRAHTLTFLPNPNADAPFPLENPGLSITQNDANELTVLSVRAGSQAEAAGIRAGDAIVAVNGASVPKQQLGVYDLQPLLYGTKSVELTIRRDDRTLAIAIVPR
jgi:hypothetical protein